MRAQHVGVGALGPEQCLQHLVGMVTFPHARREIRQLAADGRVEVVEQRVKTVGDDTLIEELRFRRLS